MARASGSYPEGHRFKSRCRYQTGNGFIPSYGPVVKRSRHRPFTAVTRVRFSSGSPKTTVRQSRAVVFLILTNRKDENRTRIVHLLRQQKGHKIGYLRSKSTSNACRFSSGAPKRKVAQSCGFSFCIFHFSFFIFQYA